MPTQAELNVWIVLDGERRTLADWCRRRGLNYRSVWSVFKRVGKGRYPIEVLYGPNAAVEARKGQAGEVAREVVERVLPERLRHELGGYGREATSRRATRAAARAKRSMLAALRIMSFDALRT